MGGTFIKLQVATITLSTRLKKERLPFLIQGKIFLTKHQKVFLFKQVLRYKNCSSTSKLTKELILMKKDRYIYPAIFDYAEDGISISFPDLPGCFSCANSDEEAIKMAKDALALHLYSMEEDHDEIPIATPINKIVLASNQAVVLIEVFMPTLRNAIENYSIKKTLSIPQWLNKLALEQNINFSQVLQAALKEQLGIRERH